MGLTHLPKHPDAPPPRPEHFDARYTLPKHQDYPLAKKNAHPIDQHLEFVEEPHIYLYKGVPVSESVTSVAHHYQAPFDGKAAIQMMKRGKRERWPRIKYTIDPVETMCDELVPSRGVAIVHDNKTISVAQPHDFECSGLELYDAVCVLSVDCVGVKRDHTGRLSGVTVFSFERAMTDEEIVQSWADNGMDARNRGTEAHLQMQLIVEGCPYREDDPEVVVGLRYFSLFDSEWEGYRTEMEIIAEDLDLAGSIDLLIQHKTTKHLSVIDYKRADKLADKLTGYSRMRGDLSHLDDCDGAGYCLQLSIYQYILETVYGFVVDERILLSIHPDKPFCTAVPYLKDEVEFIMGKRRAMVKARKTCPWRCPRTDVALYDAVVVATADGGEETVSRKIALLEKLTIVRDDTEKSNQVNEYVAKEAAKMEPPRPTFTTKWKSIMPKTGIWPSIMNSE